MKKGLLTDIAWLIFIFAFALQLSANNYYFYFIFGIMSVLTMLFRKQLQGQSETIYVSGDKVELYALVFLATWAFGIVVGFFRGNPKEYIVRCFAGTVAYLFYYVLFYAKIDKTKLCTALYRASVCACAYLLISFVLARAGIWVWPFNSVIYMAHSGSMIAECGPLIFVLEAESIRALFNKENGIRKRIINIVVFAISAIALVYTNNMGAYRLGFIAVMILCLMFIVIAERDNKKKTLLFALLFFVLAVVMVWGLSLLLSLDLGEAGSLSGGEAGGLSGGEISNIALDVGNQKRLYQFKVVGARFNIIGNGIGAVIEYSFMGKDVSSYGIEVSYLNLIDKYGIFALGLLFIVVQSFIIPLKMVIKERKLLQRSCISVALCGYMFIAMGNPVLLSAYNVMLHCFALYLMTPDKKKGVYEG